MTHPATAPPSRRQDGAAGRRPGAGSAPRSWPWAAGSSGPASRRPAVVAPGPGRAEPHLRQRRTGVGDQHRGLASAGPRSGRAFPLRGLPGGRAAVGPEGGGPAAAGALRGGKRRGSRPGVADRGRWRASGLAEPRTRRTTPVSPSHCGPTPCCSSGRRPLRAATSPSACSNCWTARGTGARTPATVSGARHRHRAAARKMNR